jgi:hypothetical protein
MTEDELRSYVETGMDCGKNYHADYWTIEEIDWLMDIITKKEGINKIEVLSAIHKFIPDHEANESASKYLKRLAKYNNLDKKTQMENNNEHK